MMKQSNGSVSTESGIDLNSTELDFADEIVKRSGVNINLCWQCKTCAGGCPFSDAMDYWPNQVIRLVQLGMKEQVLKSSSIWICVGCHTCSMECPQAIDMSSVMDAVRQVAIEEKIKIGDNIVISILGVEAGSVKIGIDAPREITILRMEVFDQIQKENIERRPN